MSTASSAEPFVIERTYPASIDKVWAAITNKDHMKEWYFDIPEFVPEVGCEFSFVATGNGMRYVHLCKVTEVEVGRRITYSWSYDGYGGMSYVTFELFAEGSSTRLKLTHTGLETFPVDPAFARSNFAGGWTSFIGNKLPKYLGVTAS